MSDSHSSRSAPSARVLSRTGAVVFALLAVAGLVDCVLAVTELAGATDLAPQLGAVADVVVLVVGAVVVPLAVILARAFAREARGHDRDTSAATTATATQPSAQGPWTDTTRIDA